MNTPVSQAVSQQQFERPSVVPMSYEAWFALPEEIHTSGLVEWVNDEAIFHSLPNIAHQSIAGFMAVLLGSFVDFFEMGKIFVAPVEVKLPNGSAREPDVFFVSNAHFNSIPAQRVNGAPDLIIEIISPESTSRDYDEKFDEYQDAGIGEYWIIDPRPRRKQALFQPGEQDRLAQHVQYP